MRQLAAPAMGRQAVRTSPQQPVLLCTQRWQRPLEQLLTQPNCQGAVLLLLHVSPAAVTRHQARVQALSSSCHEALPRPPHPSATLHSVFSWPH